MWGNDCSRVSEKDWGVYCLENRGRQGEERIKEGWMCRDVRKGERERSKIKWVNGGRAVQGYWYGMVTVR
jgi:hypothetical protein